MSAPNDPRPRLDADGFVIRDDATDLGVPMRPAPPGTVRQGPEDALDPNPTRGDYRSRLGETRHVQIEATRRHRDDMEPIIRAVEQNPHAQNIVQKGGAE